MTFIWHVEMLANLCACPADVLVELVGCIALHLLGAASAVFCTRCAEISHQDVQPAFAGSQLMICTRVSVPPMAWTG